MHNLVHTFFERIAGVMKVILRYFINSTLTRVERMNSQEG